MKIHVIQTGTVAVKSRQQRGVGTGNRRVLNVLLDPVWSEPLPIFAYAIEHPEGVIVSTRGRPREPLSEATSQPGIPTCDTACGCGSHRRRRWAHS